MDNDLAGMGQASDDDPGRESYYRNVYIIVGTMMVRTRAYAPQAMNCRRCAAGENTGDLQPVNPPLWVTCERKGPPTFWHPGNVGGPFRPGICHPPSAIRHLSSAIRHLSSAIRHLSSAISPSPFPVPNSAFSSGRGHPLLFAPSGVADVGGRRRHPSLFVRAMASPARRRDSEQSNRSVWISMKTSSSAPSAWASATSSWPSV